MISHHAALIYTMVLVSASDSDMTDAEMRIMGDTVRVLPIFRDFNIETLPNVAADCAAILDEDDGLEAVFANIKTALAVNLRETAYALACDVAAADGVVTPEEMKILEMIRHGLDLDRLIAAAIERGARARFAIAK